MLKNTGLLENNINRITEEINDENIKKKFKHEYNTRNNKNNKNNL